MVVGQRARSQHHKKCVFFFTFLKFISDHIFVLYQFEGDLGIPSSHICVSIRLFNSPHFQISVHLLTNYFEGMVYNLMWWCIQVTCPQLNAGGYCCNFVSLSVCPPVCGLWFCYCGQITWKKKSTYWYADISMSIQPFIHNIFRFLCICWKITWKEWHKIWRAHVSKWLTFWLRSMPKGIVVSSCICLSVCQPSWVCVCSGRGWGWGWGKEGLFSLLGMALANTGGYRGYLLPLLTEHSSF